MKSLKINKLPAKAGKKEIGQGVLDLGIEKDTEINGIGMGVLSDGTPYLNQRGLAALCGVQNAHIGYISAQWNDDPAKPRIQSIKTILGKVTNVPVAAAESVALTVKVTLAPTGRLTAALRLPLPDAGQLPPPAPAQLHVAAVIAAGKLSVTVAPVTALGPALVTTIV